MHRPHFILLLILALFFISEKTKACKDVAVNELGWSFQQPDGGYMLFGLKQNDTINEADLDIVKTNADGDTISIKKIKNVPVTFSFSDIMDMDSAGNFILSGISDSAGKDWFRIIRYSNDVKTTSIQTYSIPTDSFVLSTLFDWRYIKGKGYLFYGQNKNWGYSMAFLSSTGKAFYISGGNHSYELTSIADAVEMNDNIIVTGNYSKGNEQGTFVETLSLNGNIIKQRFFADISPVKTTSVQLCVSNSSFYIIGYYYSNTTWGDLYCIKADENLDTEWTNVYTVPSLRTDTITTSFSILGTTPLKNNAFGVLIKTFQNNVPITDVLLKIDSSDNLIYHKSLSQFQSIIFNFNQNTKGQIAMVATLNTKQTNDLHLILLDSTFAGINQQSPVSKVISVFPNPVIGNLHINGIDPAYKPTYLFISDETGKTIISTFYNDNNPINTEMLKPGIYFLRVRTDEGADYKTSFVVR